MRHLAQRALDIIAKSGNEAQQPSTEALCARGGVASSSGRGDSGSSGGGARYRTRGGAMQSRAARSRAPDQATEAEALCAREPGKKLACRLLACCIAIAILTGRPGLGTSLLAQLRNVDVPCACAGKGSAGFEPSPRAAHYLARVKAFMDEHVYAAEPLLEVRPSFSWRSEQCEGPCM